MHRNGTVVVTGGAGFIGSHLCARLVARGDEVVCIDDLSLGRQASIADLEANPRFTFLCADVAHDDPRIDALFAPGAVREVWHLAANSDIRLGSADRAVDFDRTFLSTFRMLERLARGGGGRFVFASTSAVFGEGDAAFTEDHGPLRPISFYGAAKLAGEAYVSAFAERCAIEAVVFRFPNVVGPHATHGVIHDFVGRVRATGRLSVLGDGSQAKPYLHVDDLLDGMFTGVAAAAGPLSVYHLAGAGLTTVRDIATWTAAALGLAPDDIAYGEGNRGWPGDVPSFAYDTRKLRALGWAPRHASDDAVRRAIGEIVAEAVAAGAAR